MDIEGSKGRPAGAAARRAFAFATAIFLGTMIATPASAQEITHRFLNPGFGGNPFNADYLLGTATIDRPAAPSTGTSGLSQQELLARQIQSRILSSLSSGIVQAITGADPGDTGEFTVGDQTITFERTLTELRLTIFDSVTGESTEIVLPVLNTNDARSASNAQSAESALSAVTGIGATGTVDQPGSLDSVLDGL